MAHRADSGLWGGRMSRARAGGAPRRRVSRGGLHHPRADASPGEGPPPPPRINHLAGPAPHSPSTASGRTEFDASPAAALAAGGRDNGAPGLRPHYHADYYGAFVFDPDGNNVEAVCHRPE